MSWTCLDDGVGPSPMVADGLFSGPDPADTVCMKLVASHPMARKIAILAALLVAFAVMTSIFVPDRILAGDAGELPESVWSAESPESMRPMGQIEGTRYTVRFYATPSGPLYSVYDRDEKRLLAELLTPARLTERYPEIALPDAHADVSMELWGTDLVKP